MSTNNISLHRVFTATPEKVFRAFSNPDAMAAWLPPYGFICTVQQVDFREGGTYRMTFENFTTGNKHSFSGQYIEIKADESITYTDKFDDPNLPGEMKTTVTFKKVSVGTDISITQENIPAMIPAESRYLGWQESLEKLKKLVEPNIPDMP